MSVVALALVLVILVGFAVLLRRPAPIAYRSKVYTPAADVLAPGDSLVYTPTLVLSREGDLKIVRTFWRLDTHKIARLCTGQVTDSIERQPRSVPDDVLGFVQDDQVTVKIPVVPPGDYVLSSTAITNAGGLSPSKVYFRVERPCPPSR